MITINDILSKKGKEKITVVTAYDYQTAVLCDNAGIDILLVGDSLGNAVLGYDSTIPVTMEDMIHHSAAVNRGRKNAFLVVDMPFMSYNVDIKDSLYNAGRLIKESGAQAVKLEGGKRTIETVKRIIDMEIPVMGHLGLTPQSVHKMGGYKVQGKDNAEAERMINDAIELERAGAFGIVLEGIPENLAKIITEQINIVTIGIGAGKYCDGQVLVFYDMLGYSEEVPKFVKKFAKAGEVITDGVKSYIKEVKSGEFPSKEYTYKAVADIKKIY